MTRVELVRKKLMRIEGFISELRALGRPQDIEGDLVQERFIEHTLQLAIQATLDIASHIVSDDRLGEPRDNQELFTILARHGWITEELSQTLKKVVGFRNIVVHGYEELDLGIVQDVAEHRVGDLLAFVAEIRQRLEQGETPGSPPTGKKEIPPWPTS